MAALRAHAALLLLVALLAACATPGGKPDRGQGWALHRNQLGQFDHWQAEGKLALRTSEQSESASLVWEQQERQTRLRLSGPVGLNSTTIYSDGQRLELWRGDEPPRSWDISSPGAITANTGWDLPLQALPHWLKGLPAPGSNVENLLLEQDRAQGFTQDGWQVEYQDYRQFGELALPTRLHISRGDTRVRLIIRNWTALPG